MSQWQYYRHCWRSERLFSKPEKVSGKLSLSELSTYAHFSLLDLTIFSGVSVSHFKASLPWRFWHRWIKLNPWYLLRQLYPIYLHGNTLEDNILKQLCTEVHIFYLDIYILQLALQLFIVLYCCCVSWTKSNLMAGRSAAVPVFSKGRQFHIQLSASCTDISHSRCRQLFQRDALRSHVSVG